jgi:hypothetical protein
MGDPDDVKETPQQRAMAQLALNKVADYKERWLPLQKQLFQHVADMAKPGSSASKAARGAASTSTEAEFSDARKGLESRLAQTGGLSSGKGKLAIAGMGEDEATAMGLGLTGADQQVDDAYVSGLASIRAAGKGQQGAAVRGVTQQAAMSGRQAADDARLSLEHRMGNAQLGAQLVGTGVGLAGPQSFDSMQARFSQTGPGSSGFGSGLAYGNQDLGLNL